MAHHGATNPEEAQRSLDVFCATIGDDRERRGPNGERTTVGELADTEPLLALPPAPFPATTEVERIVADNASVAFSGNRYSVPPGLAGTTLLVRHRLSSPTIDVVAPSGAILVTHRLAPAGSGALVRSVEHKEALEAAVLSAFTTARPCDKKANRPPGREALEEAARLLGPIGREPVVDLSVYGEIAEGPDERVLHLSRDPLRTWPTCVLVLLPRRCPESSTMPGATSSATPSSCTDSSRSR